MGAPDGVVRRKIYAEAHIFLMERDVSIDIVEVPDDFPNVIGRICLMALDFVLDRHGQQIIPNPAHNGEWCIEEY